MTFSPASIRLFAPAGADPGFLLHLVGWFVGAIEVWIVLQFMGYPSASNRRSSSKA